MSDAPPIRLRLSRAKGFDLQAVSLAANGLPAVNCARPGPWGNPFVVGRDGDRARCVDLHRKLMGGLICMSQTPGIDEQRKALEYATTHINELRGHNLACWCALDGKPCHCDTYLEAANHV